MAEDIGTIANLFEVILGDNTRYHVAQSALNTSFKIPLINKLHEITKGSIFKYLLHEAKHSKKTINVPTTELQVWKSYQFGLEDISVDVRARGNDADDASDKDSSVVIAGKVEIIHFIVCPPLIATHVGIICGECGSI